MKTPLAYKCKECGREGVAYYDSDCDRLRLEVWAKMLCCNRCADYNTRRIRLAESIWATCYQLSLVLESSKDAVVRGDALQQARERLNHKTKLFAEHVCDFYRKVTLWDPEFTQMLLDAPRKCSTILAHYTRGIAP